MMADEHIRRAEALEITTRTCGDYAAAFAEIRKLPAADVAPVVRCEDCQSWKRNVGLTDSPNGHCFEHDIDTNGRDFCSYGERMRQAKRDEGGNENG